MLGQKFNNVFLLFGSRGRSAMCSANSMSLEEPNMVRVSDSKDSDHGPTSVEKPKTVPLRIQAKRKYEAMVENDISDTGRNKRFKEDVDDFESEKLLPSTCPNLIINSHGIQGSPPATTSTTDRKLDEIKPINTSNTFPQDLPKKFI